MTGHTEQHEAGEASETALAILAQIDNAYAEYMGDPDGDDTTAAKNAAALVIDRLLRTPPTPAPDSELAGGWQQEQAEAMRRALEPFARLAGPINGEEGRPTYLEAISGPNGTDELELRTYVGDGTRTEVLDAADFRAALAALTQPTGERPEKVS